jgi:hypothetical protein
LRAGWFLEGRDWRAVGDEMDEPSRPVQLVHLMHLSQNVRIVEPDLHHHVNGVRVWPDVELDPCMSRRVQ